MLRPLKRSGGRRYYRREDVELLSRIDQLINREGYTLKGARLALEKVRPTPAVDDVPAAPILEMEDAPRDSAGLDRDSETLLPTLKRLRARLASALEV